MSVEFSDSAADLRHLDEQTTDVPLPVETTDIIIDHLHNDIRSLRACSLVCHAWLPSTRHHLFNSFTIKPGDAYFADSVTFLTTTPEIARHIRSLRIISHPVSLTQMDTLIKSIPRLRSLTLSEVIVYDHRSDNLDPAVRFPALEELTILSSNILNHNFAFLFPFLGLFQSISRLQLQAMLRLLDVNFTVDPCPSANLALTHLSAYHMHPPVLRKLIQHTRTCETLRVLWFDDGFFQWQSIAELGSIFQALGPSGCLKRIIFGPLDIFHPSRSGEWDELQIGRCQGLEELNLRTRVVLRMHVDLFATLPPTVRTIRITLVGIDNSAREPGADSQWEDFDAAFSGSQFAHVILVLETSPRLKERLNAKKTAELMDRVMNGLRSLRAQGRLVVSEQSMEWWRVSSTNKTA
ncbi:hypothetical protein C8Q74DRAFT_1305600 [Fomes fomentarius]|nr:hypothetical protein C8Q74DRAFT_1305600 [Fomes fomentarius]